MDVERGEFDPALQKQAERNALALLTASYHGAVGDVLGPILRDGSESAESHIQHLGGSIEQLTNLLSGMTVIARTMLNKCAEAMDLEREDLLDALGRAFNQTP